MFVRLILCNTRQSKGQPVPALSQPGRPAVVVVFVGFYIMFWSLFLLVFWSLFLLVFWLLVELG